MALDIKGNTICSYTEEPGVTEVTIPDGVTEIESWAFRECSALKTITIPPSVTAVGSYVFAGCTALEQIEVPAGFTLLDRFSVEDTAWYRKQNGDSVILGAAFLEYRGNAQTFVVPEGVKVTGSSAFRGCTGLTEITLPAGMTAIGNDTFHGCTGLKHFHIPEGVTVVGGWAFDGCTGLEQISIPESVRSIGEWAFTGCSGLTQIAVSKSNPEYRTIDGALYAKVDKALIVCPAGKSSITIPEDTTGIAGSAFSGCADLQFIKLHPDDPDIPGNYSEVPKLSACIETALEMLRTGDYACKLATAVKYPFLILSYLRTKDEALGAYIRKNTAKMMKAAVSSGNVGFIRAMAQAGGFLTGRNIGKFIEQAQNENQQEAADFLLEHKSQL